MAEKQPESEQPVELPPQGIGPERKMCGKLSFEQRIGIESIIRAVAKKHGLYRFPVRFTHDDAGDLVVSLKVSASENFIMRGRDLISAFVDLKNSTENMLHELVTLLASEYWYTPVDPVVEVEIPLALFLPEEQNHHCDELQGVEYEN